LSTALFSICFGALDFLTLPCCRWYIHAVLWSELFSIANSHVCFFLVKNLVD